MRYGDVRCGDKWYPPLGSMMLLKIQVKYNYS